MTIVLPWTDLKLEKQFCYQRSRHSRCRSVKMKICRLVNAVKMEIPPFHAFKWIWEMRDSGVHQEEPRHHPRCADRRQWQRRVKNIWSAILRWRIHTGRDRTGAAWARKWGQHRSGDLWWVPCHAQGFAYLLQAIINTSVTGQVRVCRCRYRPQSFLPLNIMTMYPCRHVFKTVVDRSSANTPDEDLYRYLKPDTVI